MTIRQLETFAKLCEVKNFSKTAEIMFVTQPTVTHQIQTLEDELGLKLFLRTKRSVELLPAAISFYDDVIDILARTNIAVSKARHYAIAFKENIAAGFEAVPLETSCLPAILEEFHSRYANIYLFLKQGTSQERWNLFSDNKLDIVFTLKANIDSVNLVNYTELYNGRFVCIMPKGHPLASKSLITFEDLDGYPLFCSEPMKCPAQLAKLQGVMLSVCTKSPVTYCDTQTIANTFVRGGLGVAVMPDFIGEEAAETTYVQLDYSERISYGVACRREDKRPEIQTFIAITKAKFAAMFD
jgi:DNA-binding transcriptional LysR family regulator